MTLTDKIHNMSNIIKRTSSSSNLSDKSPNPNSSHHHNQNADNTDPCSRLSFKVGVAENKNTQFRPTMEDVHTYVANFAERLDWGYFAIFDGHAGKQSARWCGNNLHTVLESEISKNNDAVDMRDNLSNSFIQADKTIATTPHGSSGCTAAVAVIRWELNDDKSPEREKQIDTSSTPFDFIPSKSHKRMLYTANVGDSRVILCREGKAYRLTYDHKGSDKNEAERIKNAGGLMMKSRVNGMLAVTRSLGDTYIKELVIGKPFTTATEIHASDEFMIIACDGLWDVCKDQTAVDLVRKVQDPSEAAQMLCDHAMKEMTTDNVTVMVVRFDPTVFIHREEIPESSSPKEKE